MAECKIESVNYYKQLASVCNHFNEIKAAIECFKKILKLQPFAVEAIISLIDFGLSIEDITPFLNNDPFLIEYAQSHFYSRSCQFKCFTS